MMETKRPTYIIAFTGASGSLYGLRLLYWMLQLPIRLELIISPYGKYTIQQENDIQSEEGDFWESVIRTLRVPLIKADWSAYGYKEMDAPPASGSNPRAGMVIVPCTMKTLSGVAHAYTTNLIERAADVMLKEHKRLILVPRETPLNLIHIENMRQVALAGGILVPANPGFYHKPSTITELVDNVVNKIIHLLDLDIQSSPYWKE